LLCNPERIGAKPPLSWFAGLRCRSGERRARAAPGTGAGVILGKTRIIAWPPPALPTRIFRGASARCDGVVVALSLRGHVAAIFPPLAMSGLS
jgi:hypothetical protein